MEVKLVVQRNGRSAQTFNVRSEEMIIGRQKGCGIRIPSGMVSRQHCLLSCKEDLMAVEDLASANGTYVNGRRITRREFVRPGDKLKIGPVTLLVQYQLTQAAIDRLLKDDEQHVVAVPLDDVEVLHESNDAEVELIVEDETGPLVMDDEEPLVLTPDEVPAGDPLDALRAIEAKAAGAPAPSPAKKTVAKQKAKPAPQPTDDDMETMTTPPAPPLVKREKLEKADVPLPLAPDSVEEEQEQEDPALAAESESPDASQILGNRNWQLPTGEDIRDILAQIEKGKKK